MLLLILSYIVASVLVVLSLRSVALGEASCHVKRTLRQPYGESYVVRNGGLLPAARRDGRLQTTVLWASFL